ncbi:MAG: hypothetical protein LH481_16285 [Burkholderiales bacterium]|nr:hypothetical protein [Burkholderiales bacterium]
MFVTWFWENNVGRFFGFSTAILGAASEPGFWTKAFPWFVFPWWIFIAVAFFGTRARLLRDTGMQVGLTLSLCVAFVLIIAGSARVIYALPLLPPLALAATGVLKHVPIRLWHLLGAIGITIALIVVLLSWYLWGALTSGGQVPEWQWIARNVPLAFHLPISLPVVLLAAMLSIGWLGIVFYRRSLAQGPLLLWTGSLAISWAVPMLLLLPWIDAAKGYRDVYEAMARTLPLGYSCVQSEQLGESERGILEYNQGIVTVRKEVAPNANCPFMLRQVRSQQTASVSPVEWVLLWSGTRPSCSNERFELYASQSLQEGRVHTALMKKNTVAMNIPQNQPKRELPDLDLLPVSE